MDNLIFKKKVIAVNQGKQEKFLIKSEIAYWYYIWTDKLGVQWKRVEQDGYLEVNFSHIIFNYHILIHVFICDVWYVYSTKSWTLGMKKNSSKKAEQSIL